MIKKSLSFPRYTTVVILQPIFFFAEQCSILQNSNKLSTNLAPRTDQSLTSTNCSEDDILKINQNANPNKSHSPDKISIRMNKICGNSLFKPLSPVL